MAPRGSEWTHEADKALLLGIIKEGLKWPLVSAKLQAQGYTFTDQACRQHFQKIRKESEGGASPRPRNTGAKPPRTNSSTQATPRKRKTIPDTSTPTGSFDHGYGNGYGGGDDEEEMSPPLKKRKGTKIENMDEYGRNAPVFKVEDQGDKKRPINLDDEDLYDDEQYDQAWA